MRHIRIISFPWFENRSRKWLCSAHVVFRSIENVKGRTVLLFVVYRMVEEVFQINRFLFVLFMCLCYCSTILAYCNNPAIGIDSPNVFFHLTSLFSFALHCNNSHRCYPPFNLSLSLHSLTVSPLDCETFVLFVIMKREHLSAWAKSMKSYTIFSSIIILILAASRDRRKV